MVKVHESGQLYWDFEEFITYPVIEKIVNKFVESQRDRIREVLFKTLKKHYFAWESEERREQHSLNNINKITWDKKEKAFQVYFNSTKNYPSVWYYYNLKGEWY